MHASYFFFFFFFFGANDQVAKKILTEIYKNLTLRSLSSKDNSLTLKFSVRTEICAEIAVRIAGFFSKNQEKRKSEKLAQEMRKSEQYDFSDDEASLE